MLCDFEACRGTLLDVTRAITKTFDQGCRSTTSLPLSLSYRRGMLFEMMPGAWRSDLRQPKPHLDDIHGVHPAYQCYIITPAMRLPE